MIEGKRRDREESKGNGRVDGERQRRDMQERIVKRGEGERRKMKGRKRSTGVG